MKLSQFICFDAIVPELKAEGRDAAITELVESIRDSGNLSDAQCEEITKAVINREKEASTGLGKGIAVPHIKHKSVSEVIAAVGRSVEGIDFSALDKKPVYSVILLLSPGDDAGKHLKAMESIFKNLRSEKFRKFLMQSQTAEQIADLIKETDDGPLI